MRSKFLGEVGTLFVGNQTGVKDLAPGTLRAIQPQLAPEFGPTWIEDAQ